MCIDFERWKLLEFFDEEILQADEGQIIDYKIRTKDNCIFSLNMWPYEESVSISLTRANQTGTFADTIFEVGIDKIAKIDCTKTELLIYKVSPKNRHDSADFGFYDAVDFVITIKPNVRLSLKF